MLDRRVENQGLIVFVALEKIMENLCAALAGATIENQAVGVYVQKSGDAATRPLYSFEQLNTESVIGIWVGALASRKQCLKHVADTHRDRCRTTDVGINCIHSDIHIKISRFLFYVIHDVVRRKRTEVYRSNKQARHELDRTQQNEGIQRPFQMP
ncbi:hypothetical protein D3C78_1081670 [compost metagenome]